MEALLSPKDVCRTLKRFENLLHKRKEYPGILLGSSPRDVVFVGDLHGDLTVLGHIRQEFFGKAVLVFLGDYIDRSPKDNPTGSVQTFLEMVDMNLRSPDEVYMLRGNHETYSHLEFTPHELPLEIAKAFGEGGEGVLAQFEACFEALPLFIVTQSGIFASHGGILQNVLGREDMFKVAPGDEEALLFLTWGDPTASSTYRGDISKKVNYTQEQLVAFLGSIGASVMLRGHDYTTLGYALYGDRLLTLFTSRRYKDKGRGGIIVARTRLDKEVRSVFELEVLELRDAAWVPYTIGGFGVKDPDI